MRVVYNLFLSIILISCVSDPFKPIDSNDNQKLNHGVFILCEGLLSYNNSDISRYDNKTGIITQDFFKTSNGGSYLGDTSTDFIVNGDSTFITVYSSKSIVVINTTTGKFIQSINFVGNRFPRHLVKVNDSIIAMSDLYDNSISLINSKNLTIIKDRIYSGPQPEMIESFNNMIFVANSAYGDLNSKHPESETLSIIDYNTMQLVHRIKVGPNLCEVVVNRKTNKLYCGYYNLPSRIDSVGGIVEIDLNDFTIQRIWRTNVHSLTLSSTGDSLFFINQVASGNNRVDWNGISMINLSSKNPNISNIIQNKILNDIWYAISISTDGNKLWIANARNQQSKGEIQIWDLSNLYFEPLKFNVGMNPNKIGFY